MNSCTISRRGLQELAELSAKLDAVYKTGTGFEAYKAAVKRADPVVLADQLDTIDHTEAVRAHRGPRRQRRAGEVYFHCLRGRYWDDGANAFERRIARLDLDQLTAALAAATERDIAAKERLWLLQKVGSEFRTAREWIEAEVEEEQSDYERERLVMKRLVRRRRQFGTRPRPQPIIEAEDGTRYVKTGRTIIRDGERIPVLEMIE